MARERVEFHKLFKIEQPRVYTCIKRSTIKARSARGGQVLSGTLSRERFAAASPSLVQGTSKYFVWRFRLHRGKAASEKIPADLIRFNARTDSKKVKKTPRKRYPKIILNVKKSFLLISSPFLIIFQPENDFQKISVQFKQMISCYILNLFLIRIWHYR